MKVQNIRFGVRDWERIKEAAAEQGVSASQYVRNWARTGLLLDSGEKITAARKLAREFHRLDSAIHGHDGEHPHV